MKYVRTKYDKIFVFHDYADYMQYSNIKDTFLKETNSIEELCDEFVMIAENKHIRFDHFEDVKSYALKFKHELYGAIWTDRGLIFVAKLNNDGEFESI